MKRTLLFISCMLAALTMSAQENPNDYIPFVEMGKMWHVVIVENPNYSHSTGKYWMSKEMERDGKTYIYTYLPYDEIALVEEVGLLREENHRVYKYDEKTGRDIILYDFSLKEGDTFTYEYGLDKPVNCKVLKQGWLYDGPKIVSYTNPASADTLETKYRRLRTWTIGLDNGTGEYHEITTWVEGVGALENTFSPLDRDGRKSCLAYVERNDNQTDYIVNQYLPFSFYNITDMFGQIRGSNLPTGAADYSADWHHQLTYELEGDRLHVYGKAYTQCGLNNYAYFYERETDDPLVHKIEFVIQEVEPIATCAFLHATEFYVSGFDPNLNYIVVDNQGVEHPVINTTPQMAYRPFVEDGKVWTVKVYSDVWPSDSTWIEYYYFDGDSIIDGHTCKLMKSVKNVNEDNWVNGVFTPANLTPFYIGALYEQDKKVYYKQYQQQFEEIYDFTLSSNDTISSWSYPVVVQKMSGGIPGFKGTYYDLWHNDQSIGRWLEGIGSNSCPPISHPWDYVGVGGVLLACSVGDEVIYCNSEVEYPYVMGSRKQRIDFTHTIKTRPRSRMMREEAAQSLYGEYNEQQLGINLDPLDKTYLVRITDESGNAVYEKAVNAGNIVGLNIDISNYAEGRYTVTVENNDESFTAQFDTQTTSISLTPALSHREGAIYNLQGQRISSLRKGLNIVNGRKVFVKE